MTHQKQFTLRFRPHPGLTELEYGPFDTLNDALALGEKLIAETLFPPPFHVIRKTKLFGIEHASIVAEVKLPWA